MVSSLPANESFTDTARQIRTTLLTERIRQDASARALADAGVTLGPWYRIGPFRDQGPLLNWMDNVESSYGYVFEVEKETLANAARPLLQNRYPAPNFPMTPDAVRCWVRHSDWIDGYYQQFPRGPAPSAGETQYVYREIRVNRPIEVEIDCIIRAPESDRRMGEYGMEHWRRTGRYTWWVNGQEILRWGGEGGRGNMPPKAKVPLKKGRNHFFAKFTNNRHAYGFAFSLFGVHPNLRHEVGFEQLWRPLQINKSTDLPYCREPPMLPDWFVKKAGWLESLAATRDRLSSKPGGA